MRKLLKRSLLLVICMTIGGSIVHWSPEITELLFGSARVEWISEQFSETLREKSELVVYELEIEAQETVSQEAWLIGTVQKVEIPYTFAVRYTIDLAQAELEAAENTLVVTLPAPQARYQQLMVDEENVRKEDWLYPLTAERYAEIKTELENRLMAKYSVHRDYLDAAWSNAVFQIENLFSTLKEQNFWTRGIEVQIVPKQVAAGKQI